MGSKRKKSKEQIALFTGAGASKTFGFPLTSEILPGIVRQINDGTLFGRGAADRAAAARLRKALRGMFPGLTRTRADTLPSITEVLSLIDYSVVAARPAFRNHEAAQLVELRTLLERGILEMVEWPYGIGTEPRSLDQLTTWLRAHARAGHIGIITTNYDVSIGTELQWHYDSDVRVARDFDFGFAWREAIDGELMARPGRPRYSLLKLHGSVNWLKCELCEHVYINTDAMITHHAFDEPNAFNICHCGHARLKPMLVAPSMVRNIREVTLLEVWKAAVAVLRQASHWLIVGYSMPAEDIAIRSMLMRAYQARADRPRITVVVKEDQPEPARALKNRYRLLFPECDYFTDGLEAFIDSHQLI